MKGQNQNMASENVSQTAEKNISNTENTNQSTQQAGQSTSNVSQPGEERFVQTKDGLKVSQKVQGKRKRFKYKIQDQKGKVSSSFLDADTKAEVISYLNNVNYQLI